MKKFKLRQFEIPYNFDKNLIYGLEILNVNFDVIKFIYVAPFMEDYIGVYRENTNGKNKLTREEYEDHIKFLAEKMPGKLQLLLQRPKDLMSEEKLKWYIDLGFTNFSCGSINQAKIIKNIDQNLTTVSSITMHIDDGKLLTNLEYGKYFNEFCLDFSYCHNIQAIKMLPPYYNYMLLINSLCNCHCDGTHHWFHNPLDGEMHCPGKLGDIGFNDSCLVRPMDLDYFDPYISTYKLQDRSWSTADLLRDIVLYTTEFSIYPGINYNEGAYETF